LTLSPVVPLRWAQNQEETAGVLGESVRTVYRAWRHAQTWLALGLGENAAAETGDDG
jgi:hypothetical protein